LAIELKSNVYALRIKEETNSILCTIYCAEQHLIRKGLVYSLTRIKFDGMLQSDLLLIMEQGGLVFGVAASGMRKYANSPFTAL
jgi:hypothetical protein